MAPVQLMTGMLTALMMAVTTEAMAASAIAYCRLKDRPGVATVNKADDILSARNEAIAICKQDLARELGAGAVVMNDVACCGVKVFSTDDSKCIALAETRRGSYKVGEGRNPKEAAGEAVLRCGGECTVPVRSFGCGEERR
jgi:hypothetical protein